ncbi:NAD(P)H-hydrate dehydratase [Paraglaciecola aquimarina]|uniref:Bifunctional NAD(P)H-hydrate repair enzyme n=1 Tax=Paraglaciecola algarum TaxID=3050085 RepID=A0ABS9D7W4_9ALTE|nr:NAD(P)H-hydrate dehydratase [Paraglaciecola sp. G1-23]MCF2949036.1 NAD(P)H-hydrate dehydratase [Paraglaciecola sp. G1-23]
MMTLPNLLNEQAAEILAYKAVSSEQVKKFEPQAAKNADCSMFELMTRAGEAGFEVLKTHWPKVTKIAVVTGNGNNAGDAYILARLALQSGMQVCVFCENIERELLADAGLAQREWVAAGGESKNFSCIDFSDFEIIVDGILGTGVEGEVKQSFQLLIEKINQTAMPRLSLDLPSGMHANTGIPMPICVHADITVSFIAPKLGLLTGIGKELCGRIELTDLAIGKAFYQLVNVDSQVVNWSLLNPIKSRPVNGNKGSFGKVLCIGGNQGMPGAIRLSAESALRAGTGLVKVYCHQSSGLHVASGRPEIMLQYQDLEAALNWCTCVVIGPGLGQDQWAVQKLDHVLRYLTTDPKSLVVDADALNLLADKKDKTNLYNIFSKLPACILTPHPGEAARLLKVQIKDIENNRYLASENISKMYGGTCVLKGAGTLIQTAETQNKNQCSWVCNGGNPGMATAGMGDLLTGIISAFLAQGMPEQQAAIYAVCAHAEAGDRVARQYGQRGMIASDLLTPLRAIINGL